MTDILIAPRGVVTNSADPQDAPISWKRRLIRFGTLGGVVGALAIAAATLPLREIGDSVETLGAVAPAAVAVVGGLLLSVLVPRTMITLLCGLLLGAATGALAALAAAIIAATATYYAGRWAGRGALKARAGSKLDRLDGWLNRRGLAAVLLVRFLPLAPFGLVGYAYGTTSVCRKRYLLGTTIAAIPSTVTYAVIGAAVAAPGSMSAATLAPAAIGFAISTAIVLRWRYTSRRDATAAAAAVPAMA
ncbi:putative membrane protein YdjX (TVP38/TMEM64 family) [Actinoplanes lutulentus]|uniref:TVP38/TMEM64 family membrane protein n=1 Tax=Actinoplanes lutulentus TaxID=1287878 RepID=A0A327ZM22_9ACTN|nr:VTT domain-containing protein [Actinoplanes lutulentus]MBB2941621.1 putative membrane protein YdjX (TVP38/TMEM64 family) [Actinoplanes lutulentus]RAK39541.1 putative membrane protein YdjX (TVP38/TMEM64 family) [Actinoplanes lutulentus]